MTLKLPDLTYVVILVDMNLVKEFQYTVELNLILNLI